MIGAKKRFQVLQRDNFRCYYCGKNGKDVSLEVDHIIPKSKGGTDEFDNLITCCRECNIGKGNEIIGVDVDIRKFKLAEHETKTIKRFFSLRNECGYGTITKNNLTFISGFMKFLYGEFAVGYIMSELVGKIGVGRGKRKLKADDFYEGKENCELAISQFDSFIWDNDIFYIFEELNTDKRNTDDPNEILNRLITKKIVFFGFPRSFNFKYSLYPNKIEEWENEMTEWKKEMGVIE